MEKNILIGSICLSDIPREVIKSVTCKDGKERKYLNIAVVQRNEVSQYGHTHFVSCSPKKEERIEGINYIIGDMKPLMRYENVTVEDVNNAPAISDDDDLPF